MLAPALEGIEETLLIPLWARAHEAHQQTPLLRDPSAELLIQQLPWDYADIQRRYGSHQTAFVLRALLFDQVIESFIAKHPNATVVQLAAGLDTTYTRLPKKPQQWFDVDLPNVCQLRQQLIPNPTGVETLPTSLFDESTWLAKTDPHKPLLISAAGIFMYFCQSQVVELLKRIANQRPDAQLVFDIMGYIPIRYRRIGVRWSAIGNRFLRHGPANATLLGQYYYFDLADRRWNPLLKHLGRWDHFRPFTPRILHIHLGEIIAEIK